MRSKCLFIVILLMFVLYVNVYGQDPNAKVTLTIADVVAAPGQTFVVSMFINDATGLTGGDFVLNYDNSVLEFSNKASIAPDFKALNLAFKASSVGKIGEITISIASATGMKSGSGKLIDFTFKPSASALVGKETQIEFKKAEIYDVSLKTIPIKTQTGKVKIGYTCVLGDVNADGKIDSRDVILTLRFAAQIIEPTPEEKCAADATGDGFIKSNDAIKILRLAVGLAAPSGKNYIVENKKAYVKLDEVYNMKTKNITGLIKLKNIDNVSGGDIRIAYDSSVLRVVDVLSEANIMLESNITEPGIIRLAFANSNKLNTDTIIKINFDMLSDNVSPIALQKSELYSSDGVLMMVSNPIEKLTTSWGKIKQSN